MPDAFYAFFLLEEEEEERRLMPFPLIKRAQRFFVPLAYRK